MRGFTLQSHVIEMLDFLQWKYLTPQKLFTFSFSVVWNKKKHHSFTSANICSIHLQWKTQISPPTHFFSAQQECFLLLPGLGKQFTPTTQLLAKTSVHFANSFWGTSNVIVFVNDSNTEQPTKPSDFIPTPPILLKGITSELFAKLPSNVS